MPLQIPSRASVIAALQTYIRAALPMLDPTPQRRTGMGAMVKSVGSSEHDWYVAMKDYADRQPFPQTADEAFFSIGWWVDITKLPRLPAAAAAGYVVFQGASGATIPAGTQLTASAVTYTTDSATTIVSQPVGAEVLSYVSSLGVCSFVTPAPHFLATGMSVTISGASLSAYNGTYTITVTDDDEFTYVPGSVPGSSPATGSIVATATWGSAPITAGTLGPSGNVSGGGTLTVSTTDPAVNATAIAAYGGISGGTDRETLESWRARVMQALGTDFGAFNADEIDIVAKTVPGVTRVWVKKATLGGTNGVMEGQVKVAFVRDGDANIFPTVAEVAAVKAKIVANCMTAHTAEDDVIVLSPTPHPIAVTLSITPDTTAMRAAVTAKLAQFFSETATYEGTVGLLDLQCALKGLIDPATRATLSSFSIPIPSADVTMADNEFPTLDSVVFS